MPVSSVNRNRLSPYWTSDCGRAVVYVGDCYEVMRDMEREQFHAVVTDPPYGLGKEPDAAEVMASWIKSGHHEVVGGGFMGKKWDAFVPQPATWSECSRVMKPGAYMLCFAGTRTLDWMGMSLRFAGLECRDLIMYCYGCLSADTEILTREGWRQYTDLYCGLEVIAWNSDTEELTLEPIDKLTIAPYTGDMVKFQNDNTSQLLTPNHRVYKKHTQTFQSCGVKARWFDEQWNVEEAADINRWQPIKLPVAGYHNGPGIGGVAYAELLGWVFTEGGFDNQWNGIRITQSSVNSDKVEIIERCIAANEIPAKHYTRERQGSNKTYIEHTWFISGKPALRIRDSLPDKHPTWSLLWSMSLEEKRAFFNSSMLGDGSGMAFFQKDDVDREWFQALAHCIGMQGRDNPRKLCVSLHDNPTTELQIRHLKDSKEHYEGKVWCISVQSGAFIARRNGRVFITGNSGYPKGRDVSKAIDKELGAERGKQRTPMSKDGNVWMDKIGATRPWKEAAKEAGYHEHDDDNPVTEEAKRWQGWNTALKPAVEPIILARRGFSGTVAQCAMEHSTGALNVDACRVGTTGTDVERTVQSKTSSGSGVYNFNNGEAGSESMNGGFTKTQKDGRWPANLIHDGSEEVVELFPESKSSSALMPLPRTPGDAIGSDHGNSDHEPTVRGYDDNGSVARLFYTTKADDDDRPHGKGKHVTTHPTVKPLDLMQYLVRLVCVPGGMVLDPFMGSGSTGCAAVLEGMRFVGIEQSQEYADIAIGRLKLALAERRPEQTPSLPQPAVRRTEGTAPVPKRMR